MKAWEDSGRETSFDSQIWLVNDLAQPSTYDGERYVVLNFRRESRLESLAGN